MYIKNCIVCNSLFSVTRGLMFRFKPCNLVMCFKHETKVPLHMWFVFFPIDVLYLNSAKEVVEIKKNFKPFKCYNPKNKARYILELPTGFVKQNNVKLKQKINFN